VGWCGWRDTPDQWERRRWAITSLRGRRFRLCHRGRRPAQHPSHRPPRRFLSTGDAPHRHRRCRRLGRLQWSPAPCPLADEVPFNWEVVVVERSCLESHGVVPSLRMRLDAWTGAAPHWRGFRAVDWWRTPHIQMIWRYARDRDRI
jgi:hypothetical protein